jgi:hypothetical protein
MNKQFDPSCMSWMPISVSGMDQSVMIPRKTIKRVDKYISPILALYKHDVADLLALMTKEVSSYAAITRWGLV